MKREDLLAEMKKSVGTQDPIVFFEKMIDVFSLLFDRLDSLDGNVKEARMNAALAIEWDPKVARAMITDQINILRNDPNKDMYVIEVSALKKAFADDLVTQNYADFCRFWEDNLGFHPFLSYE